MPVPSTDLHGSPVSLMIMTGRPSGIHQKSRIPPPFPKLAESLRNLEILVGYRSALAEGRMESVTFVLMDCCCGPHPLAKRGFFAVAKQSPSDLGWGRTEEVEPGRRSLLECIDIALHPGKLALPHRGMIGARTKYSLHLSDHTLTRPTSRGHPEISSSRSVAAQPKASDAVT
jgi:hypothetical protein